MGWFRSRLAIGVLATTLATGAPASMPGEPEHLLLVTGIGGEQGYSQMFHDIAMTALDAAEHRLGLPAESVTYLAEDPARDPRVDGRSTLADIERALTALAPGADGEPAAAPAQSHLVIMLVGHANARGADAAFNLPGPDLSAQALARLLEPLGARPLTIIVAAASSGAFVPALSGPGRVIVTATSSGAEDNAVSFGEHFANALSGAASDLDKDGRLSVLEAFEYARLETRKSYEKDKRLLTEHALLDDNGDSEGSLEPVAMASAAPESSSRRPAPDGAYSARVYMDLSASSREGSGETPKGLSALRTRKAALRARIDSLVQRKATLDGELYDERLERLLVDLTLNRRAMQQAEQ